MCKTLLLKYDIDRQYLSRKEGKGHVATECYVDASQQGLEDFIKESKESLIAAAKNTISNISTDINKKK